jgi:hypothetical protein
LRLVVACGLKGDEQQVKNFITHLRRHQATRFVPMAGKGKRWRCLKC